MDTQPQFRRKVAVKLTYTETSPTRPTSRTATLRPVSPLKTQSTNSATKTTTTTTNGTPIKARAKVNTSAITNPKQKQIHSTTPVTTARSTVTASSRPRTSDGPPRSRPVSPVKSPPTSARSGGTLSPPSSASSSHPRIRSSLSATPSIPQLRTRAQTASAYDLRASTPDASRTNGDPPNNLSSLHHASSLASLNPIKTPSRRGSPSPSDVGGRASPAPKVKIKAKVSGLARQASEALSPTSSVGGPAYPSTRISGHMRRTPSTSSAVSGLSLASSPPPSTSHTSADISHGAGPVFYPITTAVPAANPHRYSPAWSPPSNPQYTFNHLPLRERHDTIQPRVNGVGIKIIDPALVPLPAHSPPASAVSFSSRSSVSKSSLSHTDDFTDDIDEVETTQSNGPDLGRSSFNTFVQFHEMSTDDGSHSEDSSEELDGATNEDRKVKAAAKSNRKIADLEITNKSLLAINSTLESAKHRQAKEIRELKRKLRESRLILPPSTFKAVKSTLTHDDTAEDDEDSEEEEEAGQEQEEDETYIRVKLLLEDLLDSGKKALEKTPDDFVGKGRTAKVLHADELRDDGDQDIDPDAEDDTGSFMLNSQVTLQPHRESLNPEDNADGLTLSACSSRSPSPAPPPIVVTRT